MHALLGDPKGSVMFALSKKTQVQIFNALHPFPQEKVT